MKPTDWDNYYKAPYTTARLTRLYTQRVLIACIAAQLDEAVKPTIVELGGANSCFYERIKNKFHPGKYVVVDNNAIGLKMFSSMSAGNNAESVQADVLNMNSDVRADVVFSIGLIEHFSEEDTARAIEAHFKLTRPGGIVIIGFPTPTFLYRITRKISEWLRMWIFHDERPLAVVEVLSTVRRFGKVVHQSILWPLFLTQAIVVVKKQGSTDTP